MQDLVLLIPLLLSFSLSFRGTEREQTQQKNICPGNCMVFGSKRRLLIPTVISKIMTFGGYLDGHQGSVNLLTKLFGHDRMFLVTTECFRTTSFLMNIGSFSVTENDW